jgi:hypothetical protein
VLVDPDAALGTPDPEADIAAERGRKRERIKGDIEGMLMHNDT